MCKVFERVINKRLVWILEENNSLQKYQFGFRKNRSTIDHITAFESHIHSALSEKQDMTAIFFDIEKAYDSIWHCKIIEALLKLNIHGNMLQFIKNFLKNRNLRVIIEFK